MNEVFNYESIQRAIAPLNHVAKIPELEIIEHPILAGCKFSVKKANTLYVPPGYERGTEIEYIELNEDNFDEPPEPFRPIITYSVAERFKRYFQIYK